MNITIKVSHDNANNYGTDLIMRNGNKYVILRLVDKNGEERIVEVNSSEFFPGVKALEAESKANER